MSKKDKDKTVYKFFSQQKQKQLQKSLLTRILNGAQEKVEDKDISGIKLPLKLP